MTSTISRAKSHDKKAGRGNIRGPVETSILEDRARNNEPLSVKEAVYTYILTHQNVPAPRIFDEVPVGKDELRKWLIRLVDMDLVEAVCTYEGHDPNERKALKEKGVPNTILYRAPFDLRGVPQGAYIDLTDKQVLRRMARGTLRRQEYQ